jgi:hypothetical protein
MTPYNQQIEFFISDVEIPFELGRFFVRDYRDDDYIFQKNLMGNVSSSNTKYWLDNYWWENQDRLPICVGCAWCHWIEDGPITHQSESKPILSPITIYNEAQKLDSIPGENYKGTSVRAGAKYLKSIKKIKKYLWIKDIQTLVYTILNTGPVIAGTIWYYDMFYPNENGLIQIGGEKSGAHAYVINGVNVEKELFRIKNSWGKGWGKDGRAYISFSDMKRLLNEYGEICLPIENKF